MLQVKWTGNQDGFLKLWMRKGGGDYSQSVDYQGRTYWNDEGEGSLFKMGVYNGKPTGSNGITSTSFLSCTVWQPYIQHGAMTCQLHDFDFGTFKEEPNQALVCDCQGEQVYVAPFGEAIVFLNHQQEQTQPIAVRQWERIKHQALTYTPVTSFVDAVAWDV